MKTPLKTVCLPALFLISVFIHGNAKLKAQSSLHDSLRNILTYFENYAPNDKVRQAVTEAKKLYQTDSLTDSISKKLLDIDQLLITYRTPLENQKILTFTEILVKALEQLAPYKENMDYVDGVSKLGNLYYYMGQYDKALPLYQQVVFIVRKTLGEKHSDYATTLDNLANLYFTMGTFEKSLLLYKEVLVIDRNNVGEEHPDYAQSLDKLGNVYQNMGLFDQALTLLQQSLAIRKKVLGEEHRHYAQSLSNLGELYHSMGQFDKALVSHQMALSIRKKVLGEDHRHYVQSLNNIALLYLNLGQFDKALPIFEQALATSKKILGEEHSFNSTYLNNLAALYMNIGQYEKALPMYQQSLAIKKKALGEEHPRYAISLNDIAELYSNIGHYDKAFSLYQQALKINKKALGEEHPEYTAVMHNLAELYRYTGQYEKALSLFEQVIVTQKKILGEEHPRYAAALKSMASLLKSMGQHEKALSLYQQTLTILKKSIGEQHPDYASVLINFADLYYQTGQYEKAIASAEEASSIQKITLGNEHFKYAEGLSLLGKLYLTTGNFTNALLVLTESANINLEFLGRTYSSLSEMEKMILLNEESNQFNYLPSLSFLQLPKPSLTWVLYKNEVALKGMILEDQKHVFNMIRNNRDSAYLQVYDNWRVNKALIGKQLLLPVTKRLPYLDSLQEAANILEQQLSRQAVSFRNMQQNQKISPKEILNNLGQSEAAIEFIRFRFYNKEWTDSIMYAALLLLPKDSVIRFISLFEEKQLQQLLARLVDAPTTYKQQMALKKLYSEKGNSKPGDLSDSLYQMIWKPIEKNIAGIKKISFAPAGLLHRVAFHAIRANDGALLIDKYDLNQVLSTRSVATPEQVNQKPVFVSAWGNIDYNFSHTRLLTSAENKPAAQSDAPASAFDLYTSHTRDLRGGEWKSLPGTRNEINSMRKMFSQAGITLKTDSGAAATEEAFKRLDGKSPQVLHVATHGFFLPVVEKNPKTSGEQDAAGKFFNMQENPMFRSGLVLAGGNRAWKGETNGISGEDGILTSYEIAQMDMSNTDLLVLSACETALGDLQGSEGVIGLQRAFKMAGVKQMIMSLWRVPDKETTELMGLFYSYWLSGNSVRQSLRKAQLKMKEKYAPYYWAAFVVVE